MTSTAEKIRRKKAKRMVDAFPLAATPRRLKNGCFEERTRQQQDDPLATVGAARARQMGEPVNKRTIQAAAKDVFREDQAMICIKRLGKNEEERNRLRDLVVKYRAAERAYHGIFGLTGSAKNSAIAVFSEEIVMPADPATDIMPPDTRTDEEKQKAATKAWMHWKGNVQLLGGADRVSVMRGMNGEDGLTGENGWPTTKGKAFVEALRYMNDLMETQR